MADRDPNLVPPITLGENVLQAMDQIKAITELDIPRVPEAIFVQHILPIMTDRSGKVDITPWLDVAGNAQRPMDIVDLQGRVLFRVPALMRELPTVVSRGHRTSISHLADEAKLKAEVHPNMGQQTLAIGLQRHLPKTATQADIDSAKQWNAILKRYGHDPILPTEISGDEPPAAKSGPEEPDALLVEGNDEF